MGPHDPERVTPGTFTDVDDCADWVLRTAGTDIRLALPLGLGKANRLANALYQRAVDDPRITLRIITALTLEPPQPAGELERRFLAPLNDRLYEGYPELRYALDRRSGRLPENVIVHEFYMSPGELLGNEHAQRHYISSNYTHIARDLVDWDVNVVAQLVTHRPGEDGGRQYSLSCNPDLTLDVVARQRAAGRPILVLGEINGNLPFMYGDAAVDAAFFDAVVETPAPHFRLFTTPKTPVSTADHMIGLHVSTLIRDGGTLQIGIGSLGDAVVSALKLRHEDNDRYRRVVERCGIPARVEALVERTGGLGPFEEGLYGATEMLTDGFLHLYRAGILKRRVYHDAAIQRLLNDKRIEDRVCARTLTELARAGAVHDVLTRKDVRYLQRLGILRAAVSVDDGDLVTPKGVRLLPDLGDPRVLEQLEADCLGDRLAGGVVASAGFFLGPSDFYDALRELPDHERALFNMTSILNINHLYRDVELETLQRRDARFVNACLMATLTGAIVSDGLENQRVLSGVGGQFDFVNMAHALPGARSIVALRSTRESGGGVTSNIRFSYGHTTIPRHLRDIVVSEYGIADLRGKADGAVVAAMLNIADSRFQDGLMAEAKRRGKLPRDHRIPDAYRRNFPGKVAARLADAAGGSWPASFPFGSELYEVERELAAALKQIGKRTSTPWGKARALYAAVRAGPERFPVHLERLGLGAPAGWRERFYARLVAGELARKS